MTLDARVKKLEGAAAPPDRPPWLVCHTFVTPGEPPPAEDAARPAMYAYMGRNFWTHVTSAQDAVLCEMANRNDRAGVLRMLEDLANGHGQNDGLTPANHTAEGEAAHDAAAR